MAVADTSVNIAPIIVPASSENATGTPRYPKNRNRNVMNGTMNVPLMTARSRLTGWGHAGVDRQNVRRPLGGLIVLETVTQSVDQLLDREQSNQDAADRNCRIEGGNRRHRRHAEAEKAAPKIQVAEIDEAKRNPEHDEARSDLYHHARGAGERVGDRSEIEVIVAPRRNRGAGEYRIDEEGRCDLLQPQPGPADLARDDVEDDGSAKAAQQNTAQHHQRGFKRVEHTPFEVTLPLEHQSFGNAHDRSVAVARGEPDRSSRFATPERGRRYNLSAQKRPCNSVS